MGAAGTPLCRANTARRQLLLFYQGAHVAGNDIRNEVLRELSVAAFGGGLDDNSASTSCSCAAEPSCCVNASSGVAFFHTRSHWHPQLPLSHSQTALWMQRSTFCVCPGGDVTYNQRYFLALLAGCVPVIFGFTPTETAAPAGNTRTLSLPLTLTPAITQTLNLTLTLTLTLTLALTLTRPARRPARSKTARARSKLVEAQGAEQRGHQPVRRRDRPLRARRRVPARAGYY